MLLKWILSLSIILIYNQSFAQSFLSTKKVKTSDKISDFEEYNSMIFKRNPPEKNKSSKTSEIERYFLALKATKSQAKELAPLVYKSSKKWNIDPKIMIAILKTENSTFDKNAVNLYSCWRVKKGKCGDHSIAQINWETWSKEFPNLGKEKLDWKKLKTDTSYAIMRMGEILDIKRNRHGGDDWYGNYHSSTKSLKEKYLRSVNSNLKKLNSVKKEVQVSKK